MRIAQTRLTGMARSRSITARSSGAFAIHSSNNPAHRQLRRNRHYQGRYSPTTTPSGGRFSQPSRIIPRHSSFHTSSTALRSSEQDAAASVLRKTIELTPALITPALTLLSVAAFSFAWIYRREIKERIRFLTEDSWLFGAGVTMTRVSDPQKGFLSSSDKRQPALFDNLKLLELNPDFVADCQEKGWQVYSLGDYLQTLRPKQLPKNFDMKDLPDLIQREVEAGLSAALLKVLGPNLGRAVLPLTGLGPVQRRVESFASDVVTKWFLSEEGSMFESQDKGGIPISLMTLLAASDLNARVNSGKDDATPVDVGGFSNMELDAIQKMKTGEVVKGPSFACLDEESCLLPIDEFVMDRDFDRVINELEFQLAKQNEATGQTDTSTQMLAEEMHSKGDTSGDSPLAKMIGQESNKDEEDKLLVYDPEDRCLPDPVPVNPRLFPGLHLGYGKALCSHTKREVLKMRLISVLLNRLGANYYRRANGETDEIFSVRMKSNQEPITTPGDLIQALIDTGHTIEAVPTTHLTTFGVNLCVREEDGSWSNIPLAAFLESGYEDKDGRMAPAMMPHSGLDMFITGPLAGQRKDGTVSTLRVQHFNGIEGFCGWHSNEHPDVPFNVDIETGPRLRGPDAVRAARIAALYATTLNGLSSELKLPFGGYGLTAVCNDSAALVQQCLYQKSTIYPMTSIGRFLQRTLRYTQRLEDQLHKSGSLRPEEAQDLAAIRTAIPLIPSDLNAAPGNAASAAKRMLATLQPNLPFLLAKDSKHVMESILREHEEGGVDQPTAQKKTSSWLL